jgi:hypothetical protein
MTMSENGNGDAPRRRRRRRREKPRPDNALTAKHAAQIVQFTELAERKREAQAVQLRLQGRSYHQIAEAMSVDYETAIRLVNTPLRESFKADEDKLDELRQLEVARLDKLWETWFPRASDDERPNMAAANFCLKIAKRRAELVGLDRETKINVNLNQVNVSHDQLRQVVEMTKDPEAALALEKVAAMFAHGEAALEGEWEDIGGDDGED